MTAARAAQDEPAARFRLTGGIEQASLASYLAVPSVVACGGSWICERQLLGERRFDEIGRRARAAAVTLP